MDGEHFLQSYQTILFQKDDADIFSDAKIKRKCLAVNFFGSVALGRNDNVTCFLLDEDLKEYGKTVDDQGSNKINNYADYTLSLISHNADNQKQWKTNLEDFDLLEHLETLPCRENKDQINCRNCEIDSQQIKLFQDAKSKYCVRPSPHKNLTNPDHSATPDNTKASSLQGQNIQVSGNQRNFEAKSVIPTTQAKPGSFQISIQKPGTSAQSINQFQQNFQAKPGITNAQTVNAGKSQQNYFKTAREELQAQAARKLANYANNELNNYNYGTSKKSLGTRKGGVFNQFQPPVRNRDDLHPGGGSSYGGLPGPSYAADQSSDIADERLKNIDPKMVELIKSEIMDCGSKITWDDIAGLELAKNTIQEIIVWPMLRPDIFTGLRRPPKGVLLFGPPGTGKTLIGKCIASQSNSTFFSISASSLTSKWFGEAEKMVRALFAVAKVHQPAVVFIDEIDSLLSQRSAQEHECTRRIKTEFLVQLDGAGTGEEDRILIIGATNRPQELDEAARRRFVRRLYIPLPDEPARQQIIMNLISKEKHSLTVTELEEIARLCEGYSGADVKNLCQEASLGPVRSIPFGQIQNIDPDQVRPLNCDDFKTALSRIKSTVCQNDLDIYVKWDKQYGCGSGP